MYLIVHGQAKQFQGKQSHNFQGNKAALPPCYAAKIISWNENKKYHV